MAIQLTESAAKQIQTQLAKRGQGLGLRVGVKKVGCSGFAYTYDYADEVRADDQLFESHGTKVVVDAKSLGFSNGSTLDFVSEGLKQAFKFENPNVDAHVRLRRELQRQGKVSDNEQRPRAISSTSPTSTASCTDIESETAPKGLERRHDPADLGEEERAGVAARVPAEGLSPLAHDGRAARGRTSSTRRSTSRTSSTTRRRSRKKLKSMDEVDPELLRTFEKLGVPMNERAALAGVAVDVIFDSVSVATTYKEKLAQGRHHLLLDLGSRARPSGARAEVPRHRRADRRQLLRGAQFGGVHRRLVLLHPEGREVPDGAFDLFPHQHRNRPGSSSAR